MRSLVGRILNSEMLNSDWRASPAHLAEAQRLTQRISGDRPERDLKDIQRLFDIYERSSDEPDNKKPLLDELQKQMIFMALIEAAQKFASKQHEPALLTKLTGIVLNVTNNANAEANASHASPQPERIVPAMQAALTASRTALKQGAYEDALATLGAIENTVGPLFADNASPHFTEQQALTLRQEVNSQILEAGRFQLLDDPNYLDYSSFGVSNLQTSVFNLQRMTIYQIREFAAKMRKEGPSIGFTGYSPLPEGYAERTTDFLNQLLPQIGKNVKLITSPTADKGSIDALTTLAAQQHGLAMQYITAKDYLEYINPDNFPLTVDMAQYRSAKKIFADNKADYSEAQGLLSSTLICTGGRGTAIMDVINTVNSKGRVILVEGLSTAPAFDANKGRADNAVAYLKEQLEAVKTTGALKYPLSKELAADFGQTDASLTQFLQQHGKKLQFVSHNDVAQVAQMINSQTVKAKKPKLGAEATP